MRTIKPPSEEKWTYQFICEHCKGIFEAEESDLVPYGFQGQGLTVEAHVYCPIGCAKKAGIYGHPIAVNELPSIVAHRLNKRRPYPEREL